MSRLPMVGLALLLLSAAAVASTMRAAGPASAEEERPPGQHLLEMPRLLVVIPNDENTSVYDVFHRLVDVQVTFVVNRNALFLLQERRPDLKRAMEDAIKELTFQQLRQGNAALILKERLVAAARDVLGEDAVDEVLIQRLVYR